MKNKISTTLKAQVTIGDPIIFVAGRGKTRMLINKTGEHNRTLKLKDGDSVKITIQKVK